MHAELSNIMTYSIQMQYYDDDQPDGVLSPRYKQATTLYMEHAAAKYVVCYMNWSCQ